MANPTDQVVMNATTLDTAQDSLGRVLALRRLTALDRLRLFKAVGPVLSQNGPYLGMATLAWTVTAIDGVPVPSPATEMQLEALIEKLGDAGIAAAAEAHSEAEKTSFGRTTQGN